MSLNVEVDFLNEDKFQVKVQDSQTSFFIDKKKEGATTSGPNPLEVFLASLAGCIGVYSKNYLVRHSLQFKHLKIMAEAEFTTEPLARLTNITVKVDTDAQLADQQEVFLRFIRNCPIHNTIINTREIKIGPITGRAV